MTPPRDPAGSPLSQTERERALEVAGAAAREAGALLLEHLGRLDPTEIGRKSSARDLVTAADLASERLIVQRLREAFPGYAIESEEEVRDPEDERPRWLVDPLDGTVNFVHRLPLFCVSLGLWSGGGGEVAVVHAPALGETFQATRGGGAFFSGGPGAEARPMAVSDTTELSQAILGTGFPYRRHELVPNNLENFNRFFLLAQGQRRMGSAALDLAYVADGRLDGFWELYLSPHDVAAGGLLVSEAGGMVTDAEGGDDWLRCGHIVAAPPALHEALRGRIEYGDERP